MNTLTPLGPTGRKCRSTATNQADNGACDTVKGGDARPAAFGYCCAAAAAGPSRPMDNTDFSFQWRKGMTKNFVGAALADLV
jgi:hypothetical protein